MSDDAPDDQPGPAHQRDIYVQGLADVTPDLPVSPEDLDRSLLRGAE